MVGENQDKTFCSGCGAEMRSYSKFCTKCGTATVQPAKSQVQYAEPAQSNVPAYESPANPQSANSDPLKGGKVCPKCYHTNGQFDKVCSVCGHNLSESVHAANNNATIGMVLYVVGIIVFICASFKARVIGYYEHETWWVITLYIVAAIAVFVGRKMRKS